MKREGVVSSYCLGCLSIESVGIFHWMLSGLPWPLATERPMVLSGVGVIAFGHMVSEEVIVHSSDLWFDFPLLKWSEVFFNELRQGKLVWFRYFLKAYLTDVTLCCLSLTTNSTSSSLDGRALILYTGFHVVAVCKPWLIPLWSSHS